MTNKGWTAISAHQVDSHLLSNWFPMSLVSVISLNTSRLAIIHNDDSSNCGLRRVLSCYTYGLSAASKNTNTNTRMDGCVAVYSYSEDFSILHHDLIISGVHTASGAVSRFEIGVM